MRRVIFCLSITLLTFTVGILFAFSWCRKHFEPAPPIESVSYSVSDELKSVPAFTPVFHDDSVKEKFYCRDAEALKIWQTLKKSDYMKGQLNGAAETGDCRDYLQIAHRLDLNDDGRAEIYVLNGYKTGPSAFQTAWIYWKKGNNYKEILGLERDDNFKVLKTKTNGFHDLHFVSRRDIGSVFISDYKYKHGVYESVRCRVGFYEDDKLLRKKFDCDDEKGIDEFIAKNR